MPALTTLGATGTLALLLTLTIKSILLLTLILGATWFMRRSSAASRHLCLAAGAAALLALPAASLALPAWNVALVTNPIAQPAAPGADPAEAASRPDGGAAAPGIPARGPATGSSLPGWIVIIWLAGALALTGILVAGRLYGRWLVSRGHPVTDRRILADLSGIAKRLGIGRAVTAVECDRVRVPLVCGIVRPRIVIPAAGDWPAECLEAVLHHELAHVKRHDLLVQTLAQLACCLYWINPLAWVLERRLFVERERACDDMVLRNDFKPADFAGHLMAALERLGKPRGTLWVATAMAEGSDFKDRVLSVLNPAANRNAPRASHTAAVVAVTLGVLLPLSALTPWAGAQEAPAAAGGPALPGPADPATSPEAESPPDSLAAFIAALHDPEPEVRAQAVYALARRGDRRAVVPLIDVLLHDEKPEVRVRAAEALGRLGSAEAVPGLSQALAGDADAAVRVAAANAAGRIGTRKSIDALVKALSEDADGRVRERAAYWLGRLGG